jgi:hypothetical protein
VTAEDERIAYWGAFDEVRKTVAKTTKSVVVVVRDPDASNEYRTFGAPVYTVDMDLGASDLSDPDEFKEWADGQHEEAERLRAAGWSTAADYIEEVIASQNEEDT